MTLKKIQDDVEEWISKFTPKYWTPHEILARLTEENGELAREINHTYGPKKKKDSENENTIANELSDILFTIVCMANSLNIDLEESWEKMIKEKNYGRDKNRFQKI
jgi:NTP pyrophosphatase (non-canonical NTP hydrolase)